MGDRAQHFGTGASRVLPLADRRGAGPVRIPVPNLDRPHGRQGGVLGLDRDLGTIVIHGEDDGDATTIEGGGWEAKVRLVEGRRLRGLTGRSSEAGEGRGLFVYLRGK